MLDFILLALPRSGTTWASAWLTTDRSICWHDPICHGLPSEIDEWPSSKRFRGIACTGAWMWKAWFESHPARKLILDRDADEVNDSLREIGLDSMGTNEIETFKSLRGMRLPYRALWDEPDLVWRTLLPEIPFDLERHAELSKMVIQPADSPANTPTMTHLRRIAEDFRRESCR